jgi:multicomponent K+:H+ antiporter subunit D
VPRVLVVEVAPVLALLALLAALTIQAGPALSYMEAAVRSTGKGGSYLKGVMEEKALPSWRDLQPQASGD